MPQALICALEARNFEDLIRNTISIGGDCDTVAAIAIACAVAEGLFGIPQWILCEAKRRPPEEMLIVLSCLQRYDSEECT